jgi:hypothetical protein
MFVRDISNVGLADLWNSNPMIRAAGLADEDYGRIKPPKMPTLEAGKMGLPATGAATPSGAIVRRTSPYIAPPETPSGMERALMIAAPFLTFMLQRTMLPRRSARRRSLLPGIITAAAQGGLSEVAGRRLQRERERQYQQAMEDRALQRQLIGAQISELGQRHEQQTPGQTRSLVIEDPNAPG